jgi:hypothetical protein
MYMMRAFVSVLVEFTLFRLYLFISPSDLSLPLLMWENIRTRALSSVRIVLIQLYV